jgi:hypothetical protein
MSQTKISPTNVAHLRSDLLTFGIIFIIVLGAVIGLYVYDQQDHVLSQFASQLFHWLIDGDAMRL